MKQHTKEIVAEIKASNKKYKHDNISTKSCPDCGKPMLEVNGKKGKMLVCQDRECGHRKNVSRVTNARCPQCQKKLELRGEGEGKFLRVNVDIVKNYLLSKHDVKKNLVVKWINVLYKSI